MIRSMTGYGRAVGEDFAGRITVELKAVNHRYSEIRIRSPREYDPLEEKIRGYIKGKVKRGKVDVFISKSYGKSTAREFVVDQGLIASYLKVVQEIAEKNSFEQMVSLDHLLRVPDVIMANEAEYPPEELWSGLEPVLAEALEHFLESKAREGAAMGKDFDERIAAMNENLAVIETEKEMVVADYKAGLEKRLAGLMEKIDVDPARLAQEVAYLADRTDINEEVVRLKTHIEGFIKLLKNAPPIGRKMDFMVQEMLREANTIGSKTNVMTITEAVLGLKNEIERLREQAQNIE